MTMQGRKRRNTRAVALGFDNDAPGAATHTMTSNGPAKRTRKSKVTLNYAINRANHSDEEASSSMSSESLQTFSSSSRSSRSDHSSVSSAAASVSHINKNISLKLGGKGLKRLDFLNKFVREFPNVH